MRGGWEKYESGRERKDRQEGWGGGGREKKEDGERRNNNGGLRKGLCVSVHVIDTG